MQLVSQVCRNVVIGMPSDRTTIRVLHKDQVPRFDKDFISDERFAGICTCIDRDFPTGRFTFLDVGGGIGGFTDRLLEGYPAATGHVLDNAAALLEKNAPNVRKMTQLGSIEDARTLFVEPIFDIIFFNFSLHHFVADSYLRTRQVQRRALADAVYLLKPEGRLSVVENFCDGYVPTLSGFLIFLLTSSKWLAPLTKALGAKTAGTGVCYLDGVVWQHEIAKAGFEVILTAVDATPPKMNLVRKRLLTIRDLRGGHIWARTSLRGVSTDGDVNLPTAEGPKNRTPSAK